MPQPPLSIGWFSTGRGPGSRALLSAAVDAIRTGYLPARLAFVFCNRERGEHEGSELFLDLVQRYGIPLVTLSSQRFRRERNARRFADVRGDFDAELLRLIGPFEPDICALAGYMLFTAPEMSRRYPLLNLHPAPPGGPQGTWQEVTWQLIDKRAPEGGAQVQLATEDWDRGPIVSYCTFPLTGLHFDPLWAALDSSTTAQVRASESEDHPLFQAIRAEEVRREVPLFLATLRRFATRALVVRDGRILDADGHPVTPQDMTAEIEKLIHS